MSCTDTQTKVWLLNTVNFYTFHIVASTCKTKNKHKIRYLHWAITVMTTLCTKIFWNFIKLQFRRQLVHYAQSDICLLCYSAIPKFLAHCFFRNSLSWLVFMIFGLFNSNQNFLHQYFINCQRFNYSAVVFFRAHLHTTLGILLKSGKLVANKNVTC